MIKRNLKMSEKMDFEAKLKRLEEITEKFEKDQLGLDDLISHYKEAAELYKDLNKILGQAQEAIDKVKLET